MQSSRAKAPDKGSFPLDHFEECKEKATEYGECLARHQNIPKRCRNIQKDYIECRMEKGLMQKESLENLGFTKDMEWETEEQEKEMLFKRIIELKKKAVSSLLKNKQTNTEKPANA